MSIYFADLILENLKTSNSSLEMNEVCTTGHLILNLLLISIQL